jgi:hypothetical protein
VPSITIDNLVNGTINDRLRPPLGSRVLSQPVGGTQEKQDCCGHAWRMQHIFIEIDLFVAVESPHERRNGFSALVAKCTRLIESVAELLRECQRLYGP